MKLIIFFSFLVVIVSVGIMTAVYYNFTDFSDSLAREQARSGAEGLMNLLEDAKNDMKNRAVMLAANQDFARAVETKDSIQVLQAIGKVTKDAPIDSLTISDEKGIVIARTHEPGKKGDSIAGQANVDAALKGNIISVVEAGTVVKLSARAGAPVRNTNGQIVGVITSGVTLTKSELVDLAKKLYTVDTTLFLGDTREATTITINGQRQVGTKLDPKIADIVLKQGKRYDGDAVILGMQYLTSYLPLVGPDGKSLGVLFAGKSLTHTPPVTGWP